MIISERYLSFFGRDYLLHRIAGCRKQSPCCCDLTPGARLKIVTPSPPLFVYYVIILLLSYSNNIFTSLAPSYNVHSGGKSLCFRVNGTARVGNSLWKYDGDNSGNRINFVPVSWRTKLKEKSPFMYVYFGPTLCSINFEWVEKTIFSFVLIKHFKSAPVKLCAQPPPVHLLWVHCDGQHSTVICTRGERKLNKVPSHYFHPYFK